MTDCIFCKIINKEIEANIIYEDEKTLAFLDNKPIKEGHTLIIPKKHYHDLMDMPIKEAENVHKTLQTVGNMIMKNLPADGLNVGVNYGKAAGQTIFHVHYHIIPRQNTDGLKAWPGKEGKKLKEIAEKIKQ